VKELQANIMECSEIGGQILSVKSEVVSTPSVMRGDLVQSVDKKICKRRCFTISQISCEFPKVSRTVLYEIITVRLGYHHKFWQNGFWYAQNAENGFGFDFLELYHKDGNGFLNHITRVTGDETWVLFMNVETKNQSEVKAVVAHTFTKQDENFKETLSARKKMELFSGTGKEC
jgi:hypothetical protein